MLHVGENLVVAGVSYRHVPVATLGAHALPRTDLKLRLPKMAAAVGAAEMAYIGTCNRLAFVVVGPETPEAYRDRLSEQVGLRLKAWQGDGAMEHLLLVASGLESARRGEPEIRAQVRNAWTTARQAGTSGAVLNHLFAEVLKTASEVQSYIAGAIGVVSLTDGALAEIAAHLGGRLGNIAVVGVSPMTRRCAADLAKAGHTLTVASRTRESADAFGAELRARALTLDELRAQAGPFDAVLSAVGGEAVVLDADTVGRWCGPLGLLAVDFGVPPNIDPAVADRSGVRIVDMDALIGMARAGSAEQDTALGAAREIIDRHLDRLRGEAALRRAAPAIEGVVRHHQALVQASLAEINGTPMDREALGQWADRMSRRFLHATLVGVRTLAADAGPGAVESFLRGLASATPTSSDQSTDPLS